MFQMTWGLSDLKHSRSFSRSWLKTGTLNVALALGSLYFSVFGPQTQHFGHPCPDAFANMVVQRYLRIMNLFLSLAEMADWKTEVLIDPLLLSPFQAKDNHTEVSYRKSQCLMSCKINTINNKIII